MGKRMYSKKLVELAQSVDRMEMALAFSRNDLEYALDDAHPDDTEERREERWAIPRNYFRGLDEAIGMIYRQFVDQLVTESQPNGIVITYEQIIVPEWVNTLLKVVDHGEYFTVDRIRELVNEGFKVVHFGQDSQGCFDNVTVFDKEVPDCAIEVWWSRWARFSTVGRHEDICGFLDRVEGMGWQAFEVEQ